jgi:hypothetical protein
MASQRNPDPQASAPSYRSYLRVLRSADDAELEDLMSEYSAPAPVKHLGNAQASSALGTPKRQYRERPAAIRELRSSVTRLAWVLRNWRYRLPELWHSE